MESMDPLSQALAARRGNGMDPSLMAPSTADAPQPKPSAPKPVMSEISSADPPPDPNQLLDADAADIKSQIQGHVTGHASQSEYESLKGIRPRSLGERAKMEALKTQYAGK